MVRMREEDVPGERLPGIGMESEAALKQLAHVLAHRLRSLVTGIEGFADLLTDSLGSREQRDLLLRIFEGTTRIEQVLADLQRYSQPILPVHRTVHLAALVDELLMMLEEDEPQRVEIDLRTPSRAFRVDPVLLRQALLMLVQNALEASGPEGRVRLVVQEAPGGMLAFDVWNDGVIPVEQAEEQVFTPFFTTKAQNLGVGLPIARHIAEAHGGSVRLTCNSADRGVCFQLLLPLHAPDSVAARAA